MIQPQKCVKKYYFFHFFQNESRGNAKSMRNLLQVWSGVGEVGLGVVDGLVVVGVSAEMETKTLKQMPKKQDKE